MNILSSLRRAIGLDHSDSEIYPEEGAPLETGVLATLGENIGATAATDEGGRQVTLPQPLVDALVEAASRWSPDMAKEHAREKKALEDRLEEARLSLERQKRAFTDRIADLTTRLDEAKAPATQAPAPDTKELEEKLAGLDQLNQQLDAKSRMADKMLSDLNAKYAALKKERDQLAADLEAASTQLKSQQELQETMAMVEQAMAKKDARITALKKENDELSSTVEQNLYNQAHSEMCLRQEIKALRRQLEGLPQKQRKPRKAKAQGEEGGNADEIDNGHQFDGPDTTPDDTAFGYTPPPQPKVPDVPTLF